MGTQKWDRVRAVEEICRRGPSAEEREWLLRHACSGAGGLAGYYAHEVAVVADLRGAITASEVDEELVAHTTLLLAEMAWARGMGPTLSDYADAPEVLTAFLRHVEALTPDPVRHEDLDVLMRATTEAFPDFAEAVLKVLVRPEWAVYD